MTCLTPRIAAGFARSTLDHVGRDYPYKLDQVLTGPGQLAAPKARHPIFHGSFDWHSCVHGWWQLLTIARLYPDLPEAAAVRARAGAMLTADKVAGELATLVAGSPGFERPYGWAWLLQLHLEAERHDAGWAAALAPLAHEIGGRLAAYLRKLTYPLRVGTHFNTAFALILAVPWAVARDPALGALILERATDWFGKDRGCQAWEPGGDEFLSPALCESLVMSLAFDAPAFTTWFDDFLPGAGEGLPETLFSPAIVSDRADGKIAHLDGLNLSRAWCWRRIAATLGDEHPGHASMLDTAERHLAASLAHIHDDYMGEHWLASFALLALTA